MGSFASKSSLKYLQLPYLAVCILTSTTLACASDDSDTRDSSETQTSETKTKRDAGEEAEDEAPTANASEGDAPVGPEASAEAQAARDEKANPGSAAVTRFDGDWKGTTSQDMPVSFKILNRFVAHAELSYAFEGDGCDSAGELKFSAMTPAFMGAFMLMSTTDTAKLAIRGKFTADDAAEGEYTVDAIGEAPEGCNASASGRWTATK